MRSMILIPAVVSAEIFRDSSLSTCPSAEFEVDTDYHTGSDLGSVDAQDVAECCQKCSETTNCQYFTYVPTSDGRAGCWLKKARGGVRSYSGAISGGIHASTTTSTTTTSTAAPITTPIQVFIELGQSNMLGEGKIEGDTDGTLEYATHEKGLYPYLLTADGEYATLPHTRNVFIMGSADNSFEKSTLHHNEWMGVNPSKKKTIGPELGIGFTLANFSDAPTMMLKSCIGNRALGWDLLPPGSPSFNYTVKGKTYHYAAYHESPNRWEVGTEPKPISWKAGIQYDGDIARAKHVLDNLATYYPGASAGYEVAGFLWWQGDKDSRDNALAERYEYNLVNFINSLRKDFNSPNAKFVTASLGQTVMGDTNGGGKILDAMLAVADAKKYPEFEGNVAAVYTHPLSKGGSSGAHYGGNAETYMNIGEAMGSAMVGLLQGVSSVIEV